MALSMRFIRVRAPIRFTSPVTTAAPAPIQDALTSAAQDAEQEALAEETVVVTGVGSGPGMAAAAAMARSADLFGQRQDGLVVGSVHESVELLGC
ncbi:MAG TPA: hypothetical protein VIL10_00385 [Marmoricola sp.]